METLFGTLLLIVMVLGYGLFIVVSGVLAIVFNPIFWIVYLMLSGGCGCNRN